MACFYCGKRGHHEAICREKKSDFETPTCARWVLLITVLDPGAEPICWTRLSALNESRSLEQQVGMF